jgi:hypothetical protein
VFADFRRSDSGRFRAARRWIPWTRGCRRCIARRDGSLTAWDHSILIPVLRPRGHGVAPGLTGRRTACDRPSALPQSKTQALEDRLYESRGIREAGWISLSRCHPNRVQAKVAIVLPRAPELC